MIRGKKKILPLKKIKGYILLKPSCKINVDALLKLSDQVMLWWKRCKESRIKHYNIICHIIN